MKSNNQTLLHFVHTLQARLTTLICTCKVKVELTQRSHHTTMSYSVNKHFANLIRFVGVTLHSLCMIWSVHTTTSEL